MRVVVTRALRVFPGDELVVRGELVPSAQLGRLYVFAREAAESRFSPYVHSLKAFAVGDRPAMVQPVSLRLVREMPEREITFYSDIDGYMCVTQEVDTAKDLRAKVKIKKIFPPGLSWREYCARKFMGIFQWPKKITI